MSAPLNTTAPTASLPPDAMTAAPVADGAAFSFDAGRFNAALQTYRGHHIDGAEDVVAAPTSLMGLQATSLNGET